MTDKAAAVTTQDLWVRLFQARSADDYLSNFPSAEEMPAFSDYISGLCAARSEKPERVIRRGGLESSYGHRLFSGMRRPSRDTALQLAFGFDMNVDEAQTLLKAARVAPLHPKVKRDAVIAYGLYRRRTLEEVQISLVEYGLPPLGGARNAD